MVDQMLARLGVNTLEVSVRKGAQQQFRLIEPAGVRRRIERPQAGMAGQVSFGFLGDMRRALVQDQVQPPGTGIASDQPDTARVFVPSSDSLLPARAEV
jgi:hypothetical protein